MPQLSQNCSRAFPERVVLISKHFGINSGGEAIKAFQFAEILQEACVDVTIITHQRAIDYQGAGQLDAKFLVVPDTVFQRFLWFVPPLRGILDTYFHLAARKLILKHVDPLDGSTLHYISPVSPITPRFFPRGYDIVLGPLTGNIFYPPALRHRASLKSRLSERLHKLVQRCSGLLFPEKRKARVILVSGYDRTRSSLALAGVKPAQMINVVDSGVSETTFQHSQISHKGRNSRFVCSGRMVDHKGTDLAIRAVAKANSDICLDIYGDGEKRAELEALTERLKLHDRVKFLGWAPNHNDLLHAFMNYRAYLFPTIAEANGIVMQEAMMIGLPVVTVRWGGPAMLADNESAIYIEPESELAIVDGLAEAMNRLSGDAHLATRISTNARQIAMEKYSWPAVSKSWLTAAYTAEK